MQNSTYCDHCHKEIASRAAEIITAHPKHDFVEFSSTSGYFCRSCFFAAFWKTMWIHLSLRQMFSWSLFAVPFLTLSNIATMISVLQLPTDDSCAAEPIFEISAVARIDEVMPLLLAEVRTETDNIHKSAIKFGTMANVRPAQLIHAAWLDRFE